MFHGCMEIVQNPSWRLFHMSSCVFAQLLQIRKPFFTFRKKAVFLTVIWLLTLYCANQITSTRKINVIGFTIIRGKCTVIYYEKNTKMLVELITGILFMLIIQLKKKNHTQSGFNQNSPHPQTLIKQFNPKGLVIVKYYCCVGQREV